MLAAGIGRRLFGDVDDSPPKCLLRFGGKSLLQRHLEILRSFDLPELSMVVGHRSGDIVDELESIGHFGQVNLIQNPDYQRGSGVSLWQARDVLRSGNSILFMDADVLYHRNLMGQLLTTKSPACVPYDSLYEEGDEPVKLCIEAQRAVEFSKELPPDISYEQIGEWPGFILLCPESAERVADGLDERVSDGQKDFPYEEAMRDVILDGMDNSFAFVDVSGIPWIEIDFPEDVSRAQDIILPAIEAHPAD